MKSLVFSPSILFFFYCHCHPSGTSLELKGTHGYLEELFDPDLVQLHSLATLLGTFC